MRKIILVYMFCFATCLTCFAQNDSVVNPIDTGQAAIKYHTDSTAVARQQLVQDSLMMQFIKLPDRNRHDAFIDTILSQYAINLYEAPGASAHRLIIQSGKVRQMRPQWIMLVIFSLLIYTGILNIIIGKDIYGVIQAFYSKRAFINLTNEDSLLTSWAFIALFSLFGFTIGLFIYQVITYYNYSTGFAGFELFFWLSVVIIALFVIKIFVLRILGFIFDIGRLVREYISILYLTYFNLAFIFLPIVVIFSLLGVGLKPYLLAFSLGLIILIFLVQYLRSTINIISKFRFHKIYLFIYLCALEICPILILMRALDL